MKQRGASVSSPGAFSADGSWSSCKGEPDGVVRDEEPSPGGCRSRNVDAPHKRILCVHYRYSFNMFIFDLLCIQEGGEASSWSVGESPKGFVETQGNSGSCVAGGTHEAGSET